jgi:hypothetical protein
VGFIQDALKKYLGINKLQDDIRKEVRMQTGLAEVERMQVQWDELKKYYEQLNYVWYNSNTSLLERFHKEVVEPNSIYLHNFWKEVKGDMVRVHYPLASSISKAMSSILFSEDLALKVDTGNKKTSEDLTKRIHNILKDNNINELLQRGAQIESYSGSLGAKIVIDTEFSEYPQIQFYPAEQIDLELKYGKIVEIIFKDEHVYDGKKYTLKSKYGKGYIRYELYNHKNERVEVKAIPELEELRDTVILGPDGEPLKIIMAAFKPNKAVSSQFMNSQFGASDYEGLYSIFNALDELLSVWNDHYRNGRITTFISEDQMKRNPATNELVKPDVYGLNTVVLYDSATSTDKKQDVKRDIPQLSVTPFREGFENYIQIALQRAGLSRVTFGFDSVSRLSSAETLQEREKTTLKTRQDKVRLWDEFFTKLLRLLLIYDEMSIISASENELEQVYQLSSAWDYSYLVEWPQYSSPSKEEQVRNISEALKANLISLDKAYHILYDGEYTEEDIQEMIAQAKLKELSMKSPQVQSPSSEQKDKIEELMAMEESSNE